MQQDTAVQHFYHADSGTLSYVVFDRGSRHAAVVDPVLDYAAAAGRTSTAPADAMVEFVRGEALSVDWILETHAHADHLSAAQHIRNVLGGTLGIGAGIRAVQQRFAEIYNLKAAFTADGRQFDRLFENGDEFRLGSLPVRILATPGHTGDSITYLIGDAAFVGDSLFMPDYGSARCDFPGGDAGVLYDSIQALFALPAATRLYMCHDYRPGGRELAFVTTVAEQRAANIHVRDGVTRDAFVALREARDRTLSPPALLLPSLQVNIRAGMLPDADDNGVRYLKIPLDLI